MPPPTDKNARLEAQARSGHPVPAEPISFSPHIHDPAAPTAWESLRGLSDSAAKSSSPAEEMFAVARNKINARHLRYRHFPDRMFGEPAWDMLLSLYVTFSSEAQQTVSNLCSYSGAPATTALRWIDYLEKQGFVTRRSNPIDLRVVFIELSAKGRDAIEAYLADLLEEKAASALPG